jgi:transcriptional regulator with XRE-family HTH domain
MTGNQEPDVPSADRGPSSVDELVAAYTRARDADQAELLERAGYRSMEELFERAEEQAREEAMPAPTWQALEEALTSLGSESHIARRLEILRGIRGLSQEQLAARLAAQGVQMPQSSISKIEVPVKTGKGKRRDITVDEALALAKALEVPVTFLMLPDDAMTDMKLHRLLAAGGDLWDRRQKAQLDYDYAVSQLVEAARARPEWRQRIADELERLRRVASIDSVRRQPFLEDVLERVDQAGNTEEDPA